MSKRIFGTGPLKWEVLVEPDSAPTQAILRTPIPGGWLLSGVATGGLTFVPDPEHKWDGGSVPVQPPQQA